jgi:hypothetical protein
MLASASGRPSTALAPLERAARKHNHHAISSEILVKLVAERTIRAAGGAQPYDIYNGSGTTAGYKA